MNVYFYIGSTLFSARCRLVLLWRLIFAERQNSWWLWQIIPLSALIQVSRNFKGYYLDALTTYISRFDLRTSVSFFDGILLYISHHLYKKEKFGPVWVIALWVNEPFVLSKFLVPTESQRRLFNRSLVQDCSDAC